MKGTQIEIGSMEPGEADQLGGIYFKAIRYGTTAHYNLQQRSAWAPAVPSGSAWTRRLESQNTLVARIKGSPVGFMTLDDLGYIDLAFVGPSFQGQGIGQALYKVIEDIAQANGLTRLHTQASLRAKRLFEHNGWEIVQKQSVTKSNVELTNFLMQKRI